MFKKVILFFGNAYELTFEDRHKDLVEHELSQKPTLTEFEDFCDAWDISFTMEQLPTKEDREYATLRN
ncbi:MAG: hypothetical protein EOM23_03445 [Candidatus Moranbacteria bacterium]|nr:hypothetical protein [Candidatus Moranbacteria bacterium]